LGVVQAELKHRSRNARISLIGHYRVFPIENEHTCKTIGIIMRHFFSALALIGAVGATPAAAQNNKVVVELFTSQGCSSCPPADALLHDLADRSDVIALALHVDYWDYLGWKDSFAKNSHTQRQHRYAQAANATTVYTPQMVIQGKHHVIGSKGMQVMDHVLAQKAAADPVDITIARNGRQCADQRNVQGGASREYARAGRALFSRGNGCHSPWRKCGQNPALQQYRHLVGGCWPLERGQHASNHSSCGRV
jgi:hypothetical protein